VPTSRSLPNTLWALRPVSSRVGASDSDSCTLPGMPEYTDLHGDVVDMETALALDAFVLKWVDAEVECDRRPVGEIWGLKRRTSGGLSIPHGAVRRLPSTAFMRSGSGAHEYNTFDEAAREQIKPV